MEKLGRKYLPQAITGPEEPSSAFSEASPLTPHRAECEPGGLDLECALESPVLTHKCWPFPKGLIQLDLRRDPRMCISNTFPGQGITLREALVSANSIGIAGVTSSLALLLTA